MKRRRTKFEARGCVSRVSVNMERKDLPFQCCILGLLVRSDSGNCSLHDLYYGRFNDTKTIEDGSLNVLLFSSPHFKTALGKGGG